MAVILLGRDRRWRLLEAPALNAELGRYTLNRVSAFFGAQTAKGVGGVLTGATDRSRYSHFQPPGRLYLSGAQPGFAVVTDQFGGGLNVQ